MVSYLMQHGFTNADAGGASLAVVYQQLLRQSVFLAFMDCFRMIGWLTPILHGWGRVLNQQSSSHRVDPHLTFLLNPATHLLHAEPIVFL